MERVVFITIVVQHNNIVALLWNSQASYVILYLYLRHSAYI
jgi:hypothetical protein